MLKLFGNNSAKRVTATVGVEQEYFLIDRAFYALRPDLVASSRTLLGSKPPKGQELEDHYFGSIKGRVQAFMNEVEYELYRLGIPIKTRHNEVAPSQFEIAPIYEQASVAADHNQLVMEIMRSVARRHDFALLLHEKPFAGVNGSGKHNNWSVQDSDGNNLLNPGQTPAENLQFLVFLMAVLKAVHKRAGLLRMSVASSGNDHRLGANEAPPAIISVFLGEQLSAILDTIEKGTVFRESGDNQVIALGISQLPAVQRDNTDRNRTSPFAFTGNKFEFRAVGSSASISLPMTILNAAVAEALDDITTTIQTRMGDGTNFRQAVVEVVRQAVVDTKAIHFDGNGYAEEWVAEAERRGLPNLRKTPEALAQMVTPESIAFFKQTGVYSDNEAEARYHVQLERYIKDTEIEIEALRDIAQTQILPAAFQHQAILADAVGELLDVLHLKTSDPLAQAQTATLRACAEAIQQLHSALAMLAITTTAMHHIEDAPAKAVHVASEVIPALGHIRAACDELEGIVADSLWPLPKYRELLFIS